MKYPPSDVAIRLIHNVRYIKGRLIKRPLGIAHFMIHIQKELSFPVGMFDKLIASCWLLADTNHSNTQIIEASLVLAYLRGVKSILAALVVGKNLQKH
ncbi:hypothetical protein DSO57_1003905 [Entomophthora muscae]|uniref:Uncharacterized protein n=1 Tax=Entomophthora muscae TaxID=34485 RepID=A0ACC2SAG3_9FUNG|nr:hypothetical protein DSO57_1003905 [Entomophthora muscae]